MAWRKGRKKNMFSEMREQEDRKGEKKQKAGKWIKKSAEFHIGGQEN
jgi:hypothetical protein